MDDAEANVKAAWADIFKVLFPLDKLLEILSHDHESGEEYDAAQALHKICNFTQRLEKSLFSGEQPAYVLFAEANPFPAEISDRVLAASYAQFLVSFCYEAFHTVHCVINQTDSMDMASETNIPPVEAIIADWWKIRQPLQVWSESWPSVDPMHYFSKEYLRALKLAKQLTATNDVNVPNFPTVASPSPAIPSEFRTKPMTLQEAAAFLGQSGNKAGGEWLRSCIEDGTIHCEELSRQSRVFDLREFPKSVHSSILPKKRTGGNLP